MSQKPSKSGLPQTEFDAILNSIPDIIIRFDLAGKVVWWNNNLEQIISISTEQLLTYSISDFFQACDGSDIAAIINETVENTCVEIDVFLNITDHNERYHLKSSLIKCSSEEEIIIIGRDINERAQMSDALKKSQSQLQNLIDTLPFLVFLISIDNEYLLANKKFCDFMGLSQYDIVGFKGKDIFDEAVNVCFLHDNDKIISEKRLVHYEGVLDINKNSINLSVDKFPLFDEQNNIYAICGVVEDVTAQYQLQRQLQQTQKMEAIGQLTGGIAHDFNNVLASIMGYTSLTKRSAAIYKNEKISSYLDKVNIAAERARDLVQQLLAFSRGDVAGLQILQPAILAKEAIAMLTSVIPSSIKLNLKIRDNNLKSYIEVDPVQFNQSVMNLVINAKDAIVDDAGSIDVSLECLSLVHDTCDSCHITFSGKYILLSVTDNGVGISKDILARIFDPFFTTKDVGEGSGMGLSMLHGIVHSSGGHIVVNSHTEGNHKGTTIQVYFPEVKSPENQEKHTAHNVNRINNKSRGKTILVIDDEHMLTEFLSELLKQEGYNVIQFNNPLKGLNYFYDNQQNIDLIVTDQTMPEITGLELAKNIYSSSYNVPIILCSGYTDLSLDTLNSDCGINVFIKKPFDYDVLIHHISDLLN